jgi:hypothetical protein
MPHLQPDPPANETRPVCDCGYECQGDTLNERVRDGQRHARDVHGIEVSADRMLRRPDPK